MTNENVPLQSLRVDLRDVNDNPSYAVYKAFKVIGTYDLSIADHSGTAGQYGVTVDLQYNTVQDINCNVQCLSVGTESEVRGRIAVIECIATVVFLLVTCSMARVLFLCCLLSVPLLQHSKGQFIRSPV